jgi:hypothetical protein
MLKIATFILVVFCSSIVLAQKPLAKQFSMKLDSFEVKAEAKEAFAKLMKECKEKDPDKRGLLIIFKAKKSKMIALNINKMPVIEILNYMCKSSGYKYKITGHTVNITDK